MHDFFLLLGRWNSKLSLIGVSLLLLLRISLAAAEVPYFAVTNSVPFQTNVLTFKAPLAPPYIFAPTDPASPASLADFKGLDDNNTLSPPDTHGAVGTNHLMVL